MTKNVMQLNKLEYNYLKVSFAPVDPDGSKFNMNVGKTPLFFDVSESTKIPPSRTMAPTTFASRVVFLG